MFDGLIIDNFAGGGGASEGIRLALGRGPDVAINHDAEAVAMHAANHPETRHYCRNIWLADPVDVVKQAGGGRVALAWFSPDCKHFSKAKGGRPVKRSIRDLAWVVNRWARRVRPQVIMLENVEEFRDWGPVSEAGKPCARRKGETFSRWLADLERLGYVVEWRELRACDFGTPTMRKRLFLIARCDGRAIVWPEPTHGPAGSADVEAGHLMPWRTAADIIDWTIRCPSIFLSREQGRAAGVKRPLVDATMRRIAKGVVRYVLDSSRPFIVPVTHQGDDRVHDIGEPLRTVTTARRGEFSLVSATMVGVAHGDDSRTGDRTYDIEAPLRTVYGTGGNHALVSAFLAQHNTDMVGHRAETPVSTIVGKGCTQGLVTSQLISLKGNDRRDAPADTPVPAITAGGYHVGEVRAFLLKYYGTDQNPSLFDPLHSQTTKHRFAAVTVNIDGVTFAIADIGMRMLTPRELFRAQGFDDDYIIAPKLDGKPLTKSAQIRMCGNSVCPQVAAALIRANVATNATTTQQVA